jgi:O-antigen/teichoic acid export membrane protein
MKRGLFQVVCVVVPKGLGGVLTIVLNGLLVTRMAPAEFGIYAICLTLVALADGVIGAAVDMSAVKLASQRRIHGEAGALALERLAACFKLALSVAIVAVVALLAKPLSSALFQREAPEVLLVTAATAGGVLLLRSAFVHLQLAQRYREYAAVELLAQSLRVIGILAAIAWFDARVEALTLAALLGTVIAVAAGMRVAALRLRGPAFTMAAWLELWSTLRWLALTLAVSALLARLDLLLLARWSSMEQVGVFAAAQVLSQIPEMLGWYLAIVCGPRIMPAQADGSLPAVMARVQGILWVAAAVGAVVTVVAVQQFSHWLPPRYSAAGEVLLPLMVGALAGMCALPVAVPYVMFVRPNALFVYDLLSLPLLLVAYKLGIDAAGAVGAAWVGGVSRVVKAVVLQTLAWHWSRRPLADPAPLQMGATR